MKRKFMTLLCAVSLTAVLFAGCSEEKESAKTETEAAGELTEETEIIGEPATEEETEAAGFTDGSDDVVLDVTEELSGKHHAELVLADFGTIKLELDADAAPITVTNFVKLAQEGFYDGLTFHRIIDGFMMQGGDPLGNGTGGSEETIKGEFPNNGVENSISHERGVISMARSSEPDSASSQFFIVQADSTFLDGDYAAFGVVTEGMEIVDEICKTAKPTDNNGTITSDEQPVIETIRMID